MKNEKILEMVYIYKEKWSRKENLSTSNNCFKEGSLLLYW